jgi:hypothetical protein
MTTRENSSRLDLSRQSTLGDRQRSELAQAVDAHFDLLRECVRECGYTNAALAAAMGIDDPSLVWRMLNNERPWKVEHWIAIPDDVDVLYATKYLERAGFIVVAPVHGAQAARNFVSGLFGLLAAQPLPSRAGHALKAELESSARGRFA